MGRAGKSKAKRKLPAPALGKIAAEQASAANLSSISALARIRSRGSKRTAAPPAPVSAATSPLPSPPFTPQLAAKPKRKRSRSMSESSSSLLTAPDLFAAISLRPATAASSKCTMDESLEADPIDEWLTSSLLATHPPAAPPAAATSRGRKKARKQSKADAQKPARAAVPSSGPGRAPSTATSTAGAAPAAAAHVAGELAGLALDSDELDAQPDAAAPETNGKKGRKKSKSATRAKSKRGKKEPAAEEEEKVDASAAASSAAEPAAPAPEAKSAKGKRAASTSRKAKKEKPAPKPEPKPKAAEVEVIELLSDSDEEPDPEAEKAKAFAKQFLSTGPVRDTFSPTKALFKLTADQERQLAEYLRRTKRGVPADVTVQNLASKYAIQRKEILRLVTDDWLNDEIINAFLEIVQRRLPANAPSPAWVFNTFFYSNIEKHGYAKVHRWLPRPSAEYRLIVIPINFDNRHWTLATIEYPGPVVTLYDSLPRKERLVRASKAIQQWLIDEANDPAKYPATAAPAEDDEDDDGEPAVAPHLAELEFRMAKGCPKQDDGSACGVFTIAFAQLALIGAVVNSKVFNHAKQAGFRRRIAYELIGDQVHGPPE
ncbi:hypothetical protein H9P43_001719 [Blastocladiella emersonii ATCC 22665]|nr:hypothetical protein H9P43_001719 [Blastocladiella emersonii ATCC 22665]